VAGHFDAVTLHAIKAYVKAYCESGMLAGQNVCKLAACIQGFGGKYYDVDNGPLGKGITQIIA